MVGCKLIPKFGKKINIFYVSNITSVFAIRIVFFSFNIVCTYDVGIYIMRASRSFEKIGCNTWIGKTWAGLVYLIKIKAPFLSRSQNYNHADEY